MLDVRFQEKNSSVGFQVWFTDSYLLLNARLQYEPPFNAHIRILLVNCTNRTHKPSKISINEILQLILWTAAMLPFPTDKVLSFAFSHAQHLNRKTQIKKKTEISNKNIWLSC
jgi:hypothetical protein